MLFAFTALFGRLFLVAGFVLLVTFALLMAAGLLFAVRTLLLAGRDTLEMAQVKG